MQLELFVVNFFLNMHVRVILSTLHQVDLLVFDRSFVPSVLSMKFDHL
jgi:hypothetical protein